MWPCQAGLCSCFSVYFFFFFFFFFAICSRVPLPAFPSRALSLVSPRLFGVVIGLSSSALEAKRQIAINERLKKKEAVLYQYASSDLFACRSGASKGVESSGFGLVWGWETKG